jgi:hypothetical protein
MSPTKLVGQAEEHFAYLRSVGVRIPEATFYLDNPPKWWQSKERQVDLYTIVDYIEGQVATAVTNMPAVQPHLLDTAEGLQDYARWVQNKPVHLRDITRLDQYHFGINTRNPVTGEGL